MVNKTPLRLVAIEEKPEDEPQDSAAPVDMISDADAITRRVPDSEQLAAHETARDKTPGVGVVPQGSRRPLPAQRRSLRARTVLLVGGVAFIGTAGIVTWMGRGKPVAAKASVGDAATRPSLPAEAPKPFASPAAIAAAPAEGKPAAEIIRLEVSAEPMEAELSLDGNLLAGHRLNLQVPRDQGIHVVSASAPGYVPFNQQVSFSSDVVLKISLRRSHVASSRQTTARTRPSHSDVRQKVEARPPVEQPVRAFGPGMHLEGPPARGGTRLIDERNPYKP